MSAPAPEATECDLARDDQMPHYFCNNCLPPVGQLGKAACGTLTRRQGFYGERPDACHVCTELWDALYTCTMCGYENFTRVD